MNENEGFSEWCLAEIFGHKRFAGLVSEREIAGTGFVRLDIYVGDAQEAAVSRLYHPNAIYCLTPMEESLCRQFSARGTEKPLTRWELAPPPASNQDEDFVESEQWEDLPL